MVNPENVFEIMRGLHRVLVDQALRDKLKQRGYEQAQKFSWDLAAKRILEVYEEIGGQRSRKQEAPVAVAGNREGS